jgi:hypothetical protein
MALAGRPAALPELPGPGSPILTDRINGEGRSLTQ